MTATFTWPVRVYYEDTDAAGIVYHARYLHFAERARTEMLRELGFDHAMLRGKHNLVFVVAGCRMTFRRPARLDDALTVVTSVYGQSGARLELTQNILLGDETICAIDVTLAVLNRELRPKRMAPAIVDAFNRHRME